MNPESARFKRRRRASAPHLYIHGARRLSERATKALSLARYKQES